MSMAKNILEHMKINVRENITHFPGEFWKIYNSKSSATWGWTVPIKFEGYRIVYAIFSPICKGEKGMCYFDYITDEEFKKTE